MTEAEQQRSPNQPAKPTWAEQHASSDTGHAGDRHRLPVGGSSATESMEQPCRSFLQATRWLTQDTHVMVTAACRPAARNPRTSYSFVPYHHTNYNEGFLCWLGSIYQCKTNTEKGKVMRQQWIMLSYAWMELGVRKGCHLPLKIQTPSVSKAIADSWCAEPFLCCSVSQGWQQVNCIMSNATGRQALETLRVYPLPLKKKPTGLKLPNSAA